MDTPKPDHDYEELFAALDLRPLWRWRKGDQVLTVGTRVHSKTCAEIWFSQEQPGQEASISRETFEQPGECEQFLMAKKAELEADGWRKDRLEDG